MDSAASEKSIIALDGWLKSPAGIYVRQWEQACLDELTADIFGYNAVQVGLPQIDALAANRMANKWQAATRMSNLDELALAAGNKQIAVALDFAELPFASQSLDLVVLPHVLEFAAEPHQVLREVERVLIPEGQVIICGFNPASLWGLRQGVRRITRSPYLPVAGEFISYATDERLVKIVESWRHAQSFRLLRAALPEHALAESLRIHGEGGQALVALSWRGVHGAREKAGQGHDADRSGMEQKIGIGATSRACN